MLRSWSELTAPAATDVASTIKKAETGTRSKNQVPYSVGHSMAGLKRLQTILGSN